jgi:hypothetical protein
MIIKLMSSYTNMKIHLYTHTYTRNRYEHITLGDTIRRYIVHYKELVRY